MRVGPSVKNTTFAGTLSARKVGPITTTVLVAGDDADSKAALIEAVKAGGVEAIDAGTLNRARELESMGFLQMKLAASEQVGWTGSISWFRDNARRLRPEHRPVDPADRLTWLPGDAAQCDRWFPPR